jgi:AraC-like DNA-binding protein
MTKILSSLQYFRPDTFPVSVEVMKDQPVGAKPTSEHGHDFSEIAVVTRGRLSHFCHGGRTPLRPGDFLVLHPGQTHTYGEYSPDAEVYNILYDASVPVPVLLLSGLRLMHSLYPDDPDGPFEGVLGRLPRGRIAALTFLCDEIRRESKHNRPARSLRAGTLFIAVALTLARYCRTEADAPDAPWRLGKVVAYLKQHMDETVTLANLSRVAGMSRSTLLRRFRASFGMSPSDFQRRLHLRHAEDLLESTDLTLEAIAEQCGFADASHLGRTFRKRLQRSPGAIRRQKRG